MIIANNNHEIMKVNEYTKIDTTKMLINDKIPFLYELNDHDTLVVSPAYFDKLKLDIMEKLNAENENRNR